MRVILKKIRSKKQLISLLLFALIFLGSQKNISAQESSSTLYVPLIGITSVPKPLALPNGAGNVTYNYAVKNFLRENALSDIQVNDDTCSSIKFINGDDNKNDQLDYNETWRFSCTTKLTQTTQSIATVTGHSNNITASHKAYATVVIGLKDPAPLVSIVNITKVAYPLSLPAEGGKITFTYKVNNPGDVPLSDVSVTDDKCKAISSKLGDTNGNNLLDTNEVWFYTCSTVLRETTTNTAQVVASANNLKSLDETSITVHVDTPAQTSPNFPDAGIDPYFKVTVWKILFGVLLVGILVLYFTKKEKAMKSSKFFKRNKYQ